MSKFSIKTHSFEMSISLVSVPEDKIAEKLNPRVKNIGVYEEVMCT